jgi:hypothetical protein
MRYDARQQRVPTGDLYGRNSAVLIVVASNPQQMWSHIANAKVALLHEAMLNGADEPVAEGASPLQVYPLQPDVLGTISLSAKVPRISLH